MADEICRTHERGQILSRQIAQIEERELAEPQPDPE